MTRRKKFDRAKFCAGLRKARLRAGLTQSELSKKTGLHVASISHYETALRVPCYENLYAIARACKVGLGWLIERGAK